MKTLSEISKLYPTDKDFTHNYYNMVYEKYFSPVRESTKLVCEIGIGGFWADASWVHGNSLKVFRDYFTNASILGLDIQRYDIAELGERVVLDWLDQSQLHLVKDYSAKLTNYDIILDDGSHKMLDQQITIAYFLKSLRSGGMYILEDLHTSLEVGMPEKAIWGWGDTEKTTTLDMLEIFNQTGKISSDYLTDTECSYLEANIASVEIFRLSPTSITSVIVKK
jgi:hypothetical protein